MIQSIRKFLKPYRYHLTFTLFFAPMVIGGLFLFGWLPFVVFAVIAALGLGYVKVLDGLRKWLEAAP